LLKYKFFWRDIMTAGDVVESMGAYCPSLLAQSGVGGVLNEMPDWLPAAAFTSGCIDEA
jgi:hypothetical protein